MRYPVPESVQRIQGPVDSSPALWVEVRESVAEEAGPEGRFIAPGKQELPESEVQLGDHAAR